MTTAALDLAEILDSLHLGDLGDGDWWITGSPNSLRRKRHLLSGPYGSPAEAEKEMPRVIERFTKTPAFRGAWWVLWWRFEVDRADGDSTET